MIQIWTRVYGIILVSLLLLSGYTIRAQSCDYYNDPCGYPQEGVCDAGVDGVCPENSDCFDCDPCQEFNFIGCEACTNAGCVWCPSDALCLSQPLGMDYWTSNWMAQFSFAKQSTCTSQADWLSTCDDENQIFSDPLYQAQKWAFDLLNVEPVWKQGILGRGVMIRVNDPDGVDVTHPELADRFDEAASCKGNYWTYDNQNVHGTGVATLALGSRNNGKCAVGVAPEASLSACVGPTAISDESPARFFLDGLETTHISVNSWGFDACSRLPGAGFSDDDTLRRGMRRLDTCPFVSDSVESPCQICTSLDEDCEDVIVKYCTAYYEEEYSGCAEFLDLFITCGYNVLSEVGQNAITRGIEEGRDGKGIIYVFAAGNEHDEFEDVNMEGWLNTRFTIVVGAVGKDGLHASYSTTGAAVFISGPGGDHESIHNNIVATPGGGCTDGTVGTSFATPSVAGAIALVLSTNPNLGWRDVQAIIATTAKLVDEEHPSWGINGAGLRHSNYYGFGLFDTLAAVEAAKIWENVGPERQLVIQSGTIKLPIYDDASIPAKTFVTVDDGNNLITESVSVYLQLAHASRGDLEIVLTSPSGTLSVLHPPFRPENQHLPEEERWKLLSVAFYGENPTGQWSLTLTDKSPGNKADCVDLPNFAVYVGSDDDDSLGIVDCGTIGASEFCVDGVAFNKEGVRLFQEEDGRTGLDACCVCGGGMPTSDINELLSWRLVVYGHGQGGSLVGEALPGGEGSGSISAGMPGVGGNASNSGGNSTGGESGEVVYDNGENTGSGAGSWRTVLPNGMTLICLLVLLSVGTTSIAPVRQSIALSRVKQQLAGR